MAEANRKRASDIVIPQLELKQTASERECPRWPPSTLRNRERRAPGARRSSTWPCRNCGSSRPRPHRYGRHTSWHSPLPNRAAQNGELRSQHAQIADELYAVGINLMGLDVGLAINCSGMKSRQLWLAKRKTRGRKNYDQSRGHGNRAVDKTRRLQPAQPALRAAPALGAQRRRQNRIEKLRPRFHLRQRVQSAEDMRNTGHQGSAVSARVHMEVESGLLGGMKKSVEVIA